MKDDKAATSYHPPYAAFVWVDDINVFLEYPSKDRSLPGYIQKYNLSEQGLSKALAAMKAGYKEAKTKGRIVTPPSRQPKRHKGYGFKEEQRQAARNILAEMGWIK